MLGENPTFWVVEFFVTCFDRLNHLSPEDSDVSQLSEGKIIGFDTWVFDYDDDSRLRAMFYLDIPGSERLDALDASTMLDGVLLGRVRRLCESPPPQGLPGNRSAEHSTSEKDNRGRLLGRRIKDPPWEYDLRSSLLFGRNSSERPPQLSDVT